MFSKLKLILMALVASLGVGLSVMLRLRTKQRDEAQRELKDAKAWKKVIKDEIEIRESNTEKVNTVDQAVSEVRVEEAKRGTIDDDTDGFTKVKV